MADELKLTEMYHKYIEISIDKDGVYPHQMVCEDSNGQVGMYALMLNSPREVYAAVKKALAEDEPKQLIFSMDRFCKPGQGTTLNDCVAGAYWNGETWRPFIIEYQHEPKVVKLLDWDNAFWNKAIQSELDDFLKHK